MLAASYFFYGYWNWRFVFLLAFSTVVNQAFAWSIHRTSVEARRRALLVGAVAFNVSILGVFKYADFFLQSSRDVLGAFGIETGDTLVNVALPVGISFFTFQALSYVIDVYRRDFEPGSLLDFATYLSFFPHVVAGPIVRGSEFMPQIDEPKDPRRIDASRAFFLIFVGLFKKVVISRPRSSTRCSRRRAGTRLSNCWSGCTRTPCRSTPTSAATPTWLSGSRCCSASGSRSTSTARTPPRPCRTSGAAGT
jgi:D-alanyl-lipoteichoic acid acyltransferase DltB (MBOAT superfamily)